PQERRFDVSSSSGRKRISQQCCPRRASDSPAAIVRRMISRGNPPPSAPKLKLAARVFAPAPASLPEQESFPLTAFSTNGAAAPYEAYRGIWRRSVPIFILLRQFRFEMIGIDVEVGAVRDCGQHQV